MEKRYMDEAIRLAKKGIGYVNPNPLTGAVIVKDNRIIGKGYHEKFGAPHAEVNAIKSAEESLKDAALYVTLEPCFHYGKTPPCVDLIIEKQIGEVIIGTIDPNPMVGGKSIEKLKSHGIKVTTGVMAEEIEDMNRYFRKFISEKRPYVTMKTAMTLDGKIATRCGDSKWISGEKSREKVHEMRHDMMGIMVGICTVLSDNPGLTTRLPDQTGVNPRPIIVDSTGRLPLDARVIKEHEKGTIILATTDQISIKKLKALKEAGIEIIVTSTDKDKVNLTELMFRLGDMGIDSILLEGGSRLNGYAIKKGIVDEIISFVAPKIIGGTAGKTPVGGKGGTLMKDAMDLELVSVTKTGNDVMIRSKIIR